MSEAPEIKLSRNLKDVAQALDLLLAEVAGQRMGFALITFAYDPDAATSYISNCQRDDVIAAMKRMLALWEEGMPDTPAHDVH